MRWKERIYSDGDKRTIVKFAWFPIYVHDKEAYADVGETRWLEKVKVEQKFWCYGGDWGWDNIRFID